MELAIFNHVEGALRAAVTDNPSREVRSFATRLLDFVDSHRDVKVDTPKPTGIDELDDVLKRISELESRVRLTQHRLAAAAQMCADIDRDPRVHTTVQACFSHVGKAMESQPQEDDGHV